MTSTTTTKQPITYHCNTTSTCGCGRTPVTITPPRIVGGENALENSWPMIVSMRWPTSDSHLCGGVIISKSYIMTAAHCFGAHITDLTIPVIISAGMTNISDPKQIHRNVDRFYVHPGYNHTNRDFRHDIALIHIDEPFDFELNEPITKSCIHPVHPTLSQHYIKNGTPLVVIGWGDLRESEGDTPSILQQVQVLAIDNDDPICRESLNDRELQFCAGLQEGGKGNAIKN